MATRTPAPARPDALPERVRVLVVGAGFAGLGAAIKLDEAGQSDFLVLDKGDTTSTCGCG